MVAQEVILEVQNISKTFPGTKALSNVSLKVHRGEVLGVMGENGAGKSTLMNIISGVLPPDSGAIHFMGQEVKFKSPADAEKNGIGFVHQELSLFSHLSVAENIFMGRAPRSMGGMIDFEELYNKTHALLDVFKCSISPKTKVQELHIAEQQIVEIAKSLSLQCKVLILDEPTSSLTEKEAEKLFEIVGELKAAGIGILYISHRMSEIFRLCDNVTILRDGTYVDTVNTKTSSSDVIIEKMVGRNISTLYPEKSESPGDTLFRVQGFTKKEAFYDIGFEVRKGEVLGLSGLVGAGRSEVARAICGIDPCESGEIYLNGDKLKIKSYSDAIKLGIAYLTEDRKGQGVFLEKSVQQNVSAANLTRVSKGQIIENCREEQLCREYIKLLNMKVSGPGQKVGSLSGGNQQKVMIAKWLSTCPKVLFMDEPTRGIDVGAKAEIHNMIRQLASQGIGTILISSELPEIIGLCDRIIVMHEGHIAGEVTSENINETAIMRLASGVAS